MKCPKLTKLKNNVEVTIKIISILVSNEDPCRHLMSSRISSQLLQKKEEKILQFLNFLRIVLDQIPEGMITSFTPLWY